MALYTSYYTRQLALRPENLQGEQQGEDDEKTLQKAVMRRHVDYTAPYINFYEKQATIRSPKDAYTLFPTAAAALDLLPPIAYLHKPATNACIKFAGQAPSKTRSSVNVAVWMPDSRRCLTGTQAGEFCMWSSQTFNFETIIQAHDSPIRSMCFSRSGTILLSGDDEGNIRYWRTNLELVKTAPAHKEAIRQISFSPSDIKFATASDDSTVRVWDLAYSKTEQVLAGHGGDVRSVHWHPSKSLLVSGSKDGLIKLWCARSGASVATMHGHKGTIMTTEWNNNGNWVLTSSRDQTCKVYDIRMAAAVASFAYPGGDATCATWNPIHEDLFVAGGQEGSLEFFCVGRQKPVGEVTTAHEAAVWCAAWHPAGHLLTTGAADAAVKFWCRTRPGDPFFDEQQQQQKDFAALAEAEPKAKAAAPLMAAPPVGGSSAAAGMGIPGIGAAIAPPAAPIMNMPVPPPPSMAPGQHGGYNQGGGQGRRDTHHNNNAPPPPPRQGRQSRWDSDAPRQQQQGGQRRERSRSPNYRDDVRHPRDTQRDSRGGGGRGRGGSYGGRGGGRDDRRRSPPRSSRYR